MRDICSASDPIRFLRSGIYLNAEQTSAADVISASKSFLSVHPYVKFGDINEMEPTPTPVVFRVNRDQLEDYLNFGVRTGIIRRLLEENRLENAGDDKFYGWLDRRSDMG